MRALVISIHAVAPSTAEDAARLRELVAGHVGGPASLLVVPRLAGRESLRAGPARAWLLGRVRDGDELVAHGYAHVDRAGRDGRELAGRRTHELDAVVADGLAELAAAALPARGFIAPSYAHPRAADHACRRAGLRWWATRGTLLTPTGRRPLPSIGLGASTRARRALSPALARAAARALAAAPAVRLDLHPADLSHPRLAGAVPALLDLLLARGRRPVTHADLAPAGAGATAPRPATP